MIRILFVDDEPNVLHAMRRAMHCMREEWQMEFVSSGSAALETLAKTPADVIVSDMRMPGMDGWELLAEVKRLYPQTVRLVLSGYAEAGAIMRLVGSAHQYIAKPGESEALKAAIAQTQMMRGLLSDESLARIVGEVSLLPSLPQAFYEISNCLRRPNATVGDAARIISRDVAMTANVMKLVNSAFFGARRQISNVERAVSYLGFDSLITLVLGHGLFAVGAANMEALWEHSIQTAIAARTIAVAEKLSQIRVDEAFLTGMLHDVGRVVLATRTVDRKWQSPEAAYADQHHAEVGAYLLGLWGFPSHVVEAVALHHAPKRRVEKSLDLTVLVHTADRLVRVAQSLPSAEESGVEPGLLEDLGLQDRWAAWVAAMPDHAASESVA